VSFDLKTPDETIISSIIGKSKIWTQKAFETGRATVTFNHALMKLASTHGNHLAHEVPTAPKFLTAAADYTNAAAVTEMHLAYFVDRT
jgi:hypothetical protein